MNKTQLQHDVLQLPPEERLEIANALYSSLDPEPLADWQGEVLKKRVAEADARPDRFDRWEDAKARIQQGARRPRRDL